MPVVDKELTHKILSNLRKSLRFPREKCKIYIKVNVADSQPQAIIELRCDNRVYFFL